MKSKSFGSISRNFLELSSEQRLEILYNLDKKPSRVSILAKNIGATSQEIHRNLDRLSRAKLVRKGVNEHYHITPTGKILFAQMPLMKFLTENHKFFDSHDLGRLPIKFTKRLGVLEDCQKIKGVTVVLDKWKSIYKNAKEEVFDVLTESPSGLVESVVNRVKNGVTYKHIISANLIEPENREETLEKINYYSLIEKKKIERKISKNIDLILIMNEKEAGVIFSSINGEPDLRNMFYGNNPLFLDWCMDYFEHVWKNSTKLKRLKPAKN